MTVRPNYITHAEKIEIERHAARSKTWSARPPGPFSSATMPLAGSRIAAHSGTARRCRHDRGVCRAQPHCTRLTAAEHFFRGFDQFRPSWANSTCAKSLRHLRAITTPGERTRTHQFRVRSVDRAASPILSLRDGLERYPPGRPLWLTTFADPLGLPLWIFLG
jgi:hypothetical protein